MATELEGAPIEQFARNLRARRERAGLSQEHLARITPLHRTEISCSSRARREPRLSTLVRLGRAFDSPPTAPLEGIE